MTLISISINGLFCQNLKRTYKNVVNEGLARTAQFPLDIINEQDIEHLPELLQRYLKLAGVVGQERVHNVKITFKGRMRSNPDEPWMNFISEQYNFFDKPTRAFYIKAKKMGIPANGLHMYQDGEAYMKIKLARIFKIIDVSGEEMNQSETVTFLNDICFFAPAALVDLNNISWELISNTRLKATYTNGLQTICAELIFNEGGWLTDFISNDRYEINNKEAFLRPWYTPVKEFGVFGRNTLPKRAEVYYKRPDQDFCYGEFITVDVEYNCNVLGK